MPAKTTLINGVEFRRQLDAIDFFKVMLGRYGIGEVVNASDEPYLRDLLTRHVGYEEKIGCGIDYFKVDRDGYGWRCFWIVRLDGSEVHFSYRRCLTGRW